MRVYSMAANLVSGEIDQLHRDLVALDMPATAEPRASDHIDGMVSMIEELLAGGSAYRLEEHIYYAVATDEPFGILGRFSRDEMLAMARERGGDPDRPGKKDPLDFVLWQPARPGEPEYRTAIGVGRPGWHIGCSVMSRQHLGEWIDVHGGGEATS